MIKRTKKEALRLCYALWCWLAVHSDKEKDDWPMWSELGYVDDEPQEFSYCFACEYDRIHYKGGRISCMNRCIIPVFRNTTGCMRQSSPYFKWAAAKKRSERIKYAMMIATSCQKALSQQNKK